MSLLPSIHEIEKLISELLEPEHEYPALFSSKPELIEQMPPWHHHYERSTQNLLQDLLETFELALKTPPSDNTKQFATDLKTLSLHYALSKSYSCVLYNNKTIQQLLNEIRSGKDHNHNALKKLIKFDKTTLYCPTIQKLITHAQLTDDTSVFRAISNASTPRSPLKESPNGKLVMTILALIDYGAWNTLTEAERIQYLTPYNSDYIDDESFKRKIHKIAQSFK